MNMSIRCEVENCKYNNGNEHYCMLDRITVVQHDTLQNSIEHTDCACYEPRS